MFYVSSLKGDLIGISDTKDGVEEFYTHKQLSDNFSYETIKSIVGVGHKAVDFVVGKTAYTDFWTYDKFYKVNLKEIKAIKLSPCYNEFVNIFGENIISNLHLEKGVVKTRLGIWFVNDLGAYLLINLEYKKGKYYLTSYEKFALDDEEDDEEDDELALILNKGIRFISGDRDFQQDDSYSSLQDLLDSVEEYFEVERL